MPHGVLGTARGSAVLSRPAGWRLIASLLAYAPSTAGASAHEWAWCVDSLGDCLAVAHRLLRQAEEVERAFETVRGVEVLDVVVVGGAHELCATSRVAARVSRQQYEDSWTSAYDSSGNLEAVFNGTCFAASPSECAELVQCSDPRRTFPQEVDPSTGLHRFVPEPGAVNHTLWAACQEAALAWQLEQAALLDLLALQSSDQDSEQATLLKGQLREAASEVSDKLLGTTGGVGLAALALWRAQRFSQLVDPSTAPAPVDGSGQLPVSLQGLASAVEGLALAAQQVQGSPCSAGTDWATLHGRVVDELSQQTEVFAAVNASLLLDPAGFDYAQRASEAVAVGAAAALQAAALAALTEFNCLTSYDPFNVAIRDMSHLRNAAHSLLQRLCAVLPRPEVGTASSAPVQECFALRVEAAAAAVQSAAAGASTAQLLPLDFCSRLFSATAYVIVEVSPYTGAAPQGADLTFLSTGGEQRRTYAVAGGVAYMSPYVSFADRLVDDSTSFASGDKVVELRSISDGSVHRSAADGYFSPTCSNTLEPCAQPGNVDSALSRALARFVSPGFGRADGCEMTLAFPLVAGPVVPQFAPPFTAEAWVSIAVDAIPHSSANVPSVAVILGRESADHADITRSSSTREDSIVLSEPTTWSQVWRHVAVVVSSSSASSPNVFFYVDGELISSARRSASALVQPLPAVHPDQNGVFHVGPPNMDAVMFPDVLEEGRTEPYFDLPASETFFDALVDEVRVSSTALDGLAQGARLTQLRRLTVCDVPSERLEGSTCLPAARLTPPYAVIDQSACQEGYEECGARPGMCVPTCGPSTLRQHDCSCDCQPGYFQAWLAKALRLSGSGSVGAVIVYGVQHSVLGSLPDGGSLPLSFVFESAKQVALLTVVGVGSATSVTLEIETAQGMIVPVPEWTSVPLPSDQVFVVHHRRLHDLFDPALTCAICPTGSGQDVFASQLPRLDLMACLCGQNFGRDMLGRCVPLEAALQAPEISPSEGFHSPGTPVHLAHSVLDGELDTPWLLEVRYELGMKGLSAAAPSCVSSPVFDGDLDVVQRQETTEIRAVLCHPLHYASAVAVATLIGNDHMAPPECTKTGTVSESTDSIWALNVTLELTVSGVSDATIYYVLDGVEEVYRGPVVLTAPGFGQIQTWAKKSGFDDSVKATCSYAIDGEARATIAPVWPQPNVQLGGFVSADQAFLVQRGASSVEFELGPGGGTLQQPARFQWRAWRLGEPGRWRDDMPVHLPVDWSSEAGADRVLKVECRVKEAGHVWSTPASFQFLVLGLTDPPLVQASPSQAWGVGAQWGEGPAREAALQQVHRVTIERPERGAFVYFAVTHGSWDMGGHRLLAVSTSDVASVAAGGVVERFEEHHLSGHAPEDVQEQCDPARGSPDSPRLCAYDGVFEVFGGLTVTAFAWAGGSLESAAVAELVPLRLDPRRDDPEFQATVVNRGSSWVDISGVPALKVLPSSAVRLDVQLSYDGEGSAAQTCILASRFSHSGGSVDVAATLDGCSWSEYNGPMSVQLASAAEGAGLGPGESVNVTVLTTVRRAGYLWAYPTGVSFLLLRERTEAPSVSGVQGSTASAKVMAMVWLTGQAFGSSPECYFTVHHEQVPEGISLAEVPEATVTVADWPSALKATSVRSSAAIRETWEEDVGSCAWGDGKICRLELDETERGRRIQTSADLPYVCAWAVVRGRLGSAPTCVRMDAGALRAPVAPSFVPRSAADAARAGAAASLAGSLGALGGDAVTLGGGAAARSRWAGAGGRSGAAGLPVFLNDSLPLQHRHAAVAVDAAALLAGTPAEQLLDGATFTEPVLLGSAEVPVTVPHPAGASGSDHVLFAVSTRSLEYVADGLKQWGQEGLHLCVALQGQHPPLGMERTGRTVRLQSPRAGSSILFRWSSGKLEEPLAADGGPAVGLEVGFASLQEAYQIRVQVVQHDPNVTLPQCFLAAGASSAQAPVLCQGGESVDVEPPDGG
ncbi:unnamed protein product, partial [Prorocentrum cordatum]